jgi:acyl-CoA thioesterase-1
MLLQAREPLKIVVLGDSISAAYGMNIEQGWVHLWAQSLQDRARVINASISGETTAGGLARLPALLNTHEPDLVIIELGGNDGLRGYPVSQLKRNLSEMITLSQNAGAQVGLIPMKIPPNYGAAYTEKFFQAFTQVANDHSVTLLPFFLENVAPAPALMQADGIHPKAGAQALLLQALEPVLSNMVRVNLEITQ